MSEIWTPLKLIQWTKGYFEKAGILNPRLDAELLLAHLLKCQRIDLYTNHEKKIGEKDLAKFKELIRRRVKREPLQYIIGEAEFYGLKFKVTPDVLIPRPETELLVEEALRPTTQPPPLAGASAATFRAPAANEPSRTKREFSLSAGTPEGPAAPGNAGFRGCVVGSFNILDIGTGSGCIAIALAKNLPEAKIVATDISKEALEIASENARRHEVDSRIEFILSDIAPWKVFQEEEQKFDLITSNPPYIPSEEIKGLQPEVRDFDPQEALDGGSDGLAFYRRILHDAPHFLKPEGAVLFEIGENQGGAVKALFLENNFSEVEMKKDLQGHDRILKGSNYSGPYR